MSNLEQHWYRPSHTFLTFSLLPLSWIFSSLVIFRRFLYTIKLKKIYIFSVPIIVVGNITVGGTGKTPFVIGLAKFLKEQGFKPGIVSRGVGGKQKREPRWVTQDSSVQEVGDEAILLMRRTKCPVVIGINRVSAVKELLAQTDCNIIISDDGLQHYSLGRDIEIAMLDEMRGIGNASFLPAGPLRESVSRLKEVDFVVRHKDSSADDLSMTLQGEILHSVQNEKITLALSQLKQSPVHAVAAIGNPQRFFNSLRKQGLNIIEHIFPDHSHYLANDFHFEDSFPIIMTEKDAVKCSEFANEKFWYLPVEANIKGLEDKLLLKLQNIMNARNNIHK